MAKKKKTAQKRKKAARRPAARKVKRQVRIKQRKVVRKVPRKASPKQARQSLPKPVLMQVKEKEIGSISHFFPNIDVGIIEITKGQVRVGDKIRIKGSTTDFTQTVKSLQFEHQPIQAAQSGQSIGIKVEQRVREHDKVYKAA